MILVSAVDTLSLQKLNSLQKLGGRTSMLFGNLINSDTCRTQQQEAWAH